MKKKKWASKIYLTNEPALCSRLVKGFKILLQQLCLVFFCEHLNQEQEQEQEQEQDIDHARLHVKTRYSVCSVLRDLQIGKYRSFPHRPP